MLRFAQSYKKLMSLKTPELPLLAIVGATGTGKSDLAVALAERFDGEIINGDALQLYEGLPIATNKISKKSMKNIPHHLLGCIGLDETPWTVGRFTAEAIQVMDSIRSRNKLPILVGGTHYYTQSILFHHRIVDDGHGLSARNQDSEAVYQILNKSGYEMLEVLRKVDPEMASKWHPNDTRKIRRSLQIWLQTGRKASDIYREQRGSFESFDESNAYLRYDTLVFWAHTDRDVLDERTSSRLDSMLSNDLLSELHSLKEYYELRLDEGVTIDKTRGIWVAIGYKEFENYLNAKARADHDSEITRLRNLGLERAKIATRQYSKRQVRWIQRQLLPAFRKSNAENRVFLLDTTDPSQWNEQVLENAIAITNNFLKGNDLPDPRFLSLSARKILLKVEVSEEESSCSRYCDICSTTCTTKRTWDQHLNSKGHKKKTNHRQSLSEWEATITCSI